jgi:hypothetical protein
MSQKTFKYSNKKNNCNLATGVLSTHCSLLERFDPGLNSQNRPCINLDGATTERIIDQIKNAQTVH